MSVQDRIKMMQQGNINNKPKPAPVPGPQKRNSAMINPFNFNPSKATENNKTNDNKQAAGSGNKFNMMKQMLERKGVGGPRPSAQLMGVPNFGNLGQNNNAQNSGIIQEKTDKIGAYDRYY